MATTDPLAPKVPATPDPQAAQTGMLDAKQADQFAGYVNQYKDPTESTIAALEYGRGRGWSPETTVQAWNQTQGGNKTVADYERAMAENNIGKVSYKPPKLLGEPRKSTLNSKSPMSMMLSPQGINARAYAAPAAPVGQRGAPSSPFAQLMYEGGVGDEEATVRGLKHSLMQGWTPERTAQEWNSALGSDFTVQDYYAAMQRHGLGAWGATQGAGAAPQGGAAIPQAGGGMLGSVNKASAAAPASSPSAQAAVPTSAQTSTVSLPAGWASYSPAQKIAFYNANGVTPAQLRAAGVSEDELYWMAGNGYTPRDAALSAQETVESSRRKNPAPASGSEFAPNLDSQINPASETIEGRIRSLLATDERGGYTNPVVRQAVDRAMQQMAGRGLLNSSMAAQAAQEAAIAKAIEIAGPDADRYFQQGRANQDAQNVFARDERGYAQDQSKLDKQLAFNREQLALDRDKFGESVSQFDRQYGLDRDKFGESVSQFMQNYALERDKLTQSGSQFNKELAYKYDALKLEGDTRAEAESRAHQYAMEINNITSVNSAYDLYLRRISDIDNNTEYSAEVKVQMKNQAGKDFDIYARAKGISLEMDLGNRFSAASSAAALPKPVAGMLASQGDYGQGGA